MARQLRQRFLPLCVAGLLGVAAALYGIALGATSFRSGHEVRAALISHDMLERDDFIVPRLRGQLWLTKPPFYYWTVAASRALFGNGEGAVRLPSAAAALGTIFLTFLLGRLLWNAAAGLYAAGVLTTTFYIITSARTAMLDDHLMLLTTAAFFAWSRAQHGERLDRRWLYAAFALAGLAVLTKGPLGFLPLLFWAVALLAQGRRERLRSSFPLAALGLFLVIGLSWYPAIIWKLTQSGPVLERVGGRNVLTYLGVSGPHPKPWWWYGADLPARFLPWSLLLLAALALVGSAAKRRKDASVRLVLVWLGGFLVLLSLNGTKHSRYLLPSLPAAALLTGYLWSELSGGRLGPAEQRWAQLGLYLTSVLLALPLLALFWFSLVPALPRFLEHLAAPADRGLLREAWRTWQGSRLWVLLGNAASLGLLGLGCRAVRRRPQWAFAAVFVVTSALSLAYVGLLQPRLEALRSPKRLGALVTSIVPPGEKLYLFKRLRTYEHYYLPQPFVFVAQKDRRLPLWQSPRRAWFIFGAGDYARMAPELKATGYVAARLHGKRLYLLVTNHAAAAEHQPAQPGTQEGGGMVR